MYAASLEKLFEIKHLEAMHKKIDDNDKLRLCFVHKNTSKTFELPKIVVFGNLKSFRTPQRMNLLRSKFKIAVAPNTMNETYPS